MIDVDECGIEIQRVNRKYGHSAVGIRIVRPGHYSKDTKLTLILAIEPGNPALPPHVHGSTVNPRRWYRILMKAGTSTFEFNNFLEMVCNDLLNYNPPGQVGNQSRIFFVGQSILTLCSTDPSDSGGYIQSFDHSKATLQAS